MYSDAGDASSHGRFAVSGDIELALSYNYKQNTLEVHVKRCRGIAAVDTKRNSSDPSVSTTITQYTGLLHHTDTHTQVGCSPTCHLQTVHDCI